jgi:hypothetical protein
MGHIRPTINGERIRQIQELIHANPNWHRSRLSKELCMLWGWQSASGQLKDISCRDLLRDLDRAGTICLPPALKTARRPGMGADKVNHLAHDTKDIDAGLRELMPLRMETVGTKAGNEEFKSYIDQYHYLGFDRSVGENIRYLVRACNHVPVACLMFSSSAWKCRARDEYVGWDRENRQAGLHLVTNNSRFLVFPWVRVRHLASHILAKAAHRVSGDFQDKYGHPILLLETFVERGRFFGTCYKAANWIHVGGTTGRGRDSADHSAVLPIKDVYLYPLTAKFREALAGRERQGY